MKHKKLPKKAIKHFMEGWIEFESKKMAKLVAELPIKQYSSIFEKEKQVF